MPTRSASLEELALRAQFKELAERVDEQVAGDLDQPLAHWTVPSDRRLPYALLSRTARQLLHTPFDDLLATPGIGSKKAASLVTLLRRATTERPDPVETPRQPESLSFRSHAFDPQRLSDSVWLEWCETVRRHHLQDEPLGRLVSSLKKLPTVIWHQPLSTYLGLSTAEVRALKTHGDKRVNAVFEVFHTIHRTLGAASDNPRLTVSLRPPLMAAIERWIWETLEAEQAPAAGDMRQHLVLPLLNQIEADAGGTVHQLAAGRLGIEAPPESVRDQARELGRTRARIYQLLEACSDIMKVRWPEGKWLLKILALKLESAAADQEALELVAALQPLLYPRRTIQRVAPPTPA